MEMVGTNKGMELLVGTKRRLMVDGKNHHEAKKYWNRHWPGITFERPSCLLLYQTSVLCCFGRLRFSVLGMI